MARFYIEVLSNTRLGKFPGRNFIPLTHAAETGSQRQSMTLEDVHRHEKQAPESGVEFMAPISGAGFPGALRGKCLESYTAEPLTAVLVVFPSWYPAQRRGFMELVESHENEE